LSKIHELVARVKNCQRRNKIRFEIDKKEQNLLIVIQYNSEWSVYE